MCKKLILMSIMVAFFSISAHAQVETVQTDDVIVKEFIAEEALMEEELCEGCVSLDLRGVDIRNVLQILSYKSGMNIVAGPEVVGLVTIQLKNVPWQDALSVVLNTYGYGYETRGSIITVTTIEKLKKSRQDALVLSDQEPLTTQTFVLDYASAPEVITSLEKMLTARGSLNYNQRSNAIIVTDTASNIALVEKVIKRLDTPTPQVLIEAKIIQTTLLDDENLGVDWTIKAGIRGAARPILYPFTQSTSNKFAKGAGMEFPTPPANQFTFGTLDFSEFQSVLELLQRRSGTEVLSNPRIVTLDNQPARISVGSQYPLPKYEYSSEIGQLKISGWEYKEIGILFEVTPQINSAGFVTLAVYPKITAIAGLVTVENTEIPLLSAEEAFTRVRIQDGQTLVIAGLIKDEVKEVKNKVPFLGSIPVLGLPFRYTKKEVNKTELLIFITPHIITDKHLDHRELMEERISTLKSVAK